MAAGAAARSLHEEGARRAAKAAMIAKAKATGQPIPDTKDKEPLKGTGGTDLVKFLKDTRNRTGATMIS